MGSSASPPASVPTSCSSRLDRPLGFEAQRVRAARLIFLLSLWGVSATARSAPRRQALAELNPGSRSGALPRTRGKPLVALPRQRDTSSIRRKGRQTRRYVAVVFVFCPLAVDIHVAESL